MAGEEMVFTAERLYGVEREASVRWNSHLFSGGSLRSYRLGTGCPHSFWKIVFKMTCRGKRRQESPGMDDYLSK